ncbi:MAG: hypothetical protein HZA10_10655 [Nitrospirae bacterium]|nr:hypothetical protein [Nitrospirota bacterium]
MKKSIILLLILAVAIAAAILVTNKYTSTSKFCGTTCHIMKKPYVTWEVSKHKEVACVECHYAPGEKYTVKARMKGLAQLFSYLSTREKEVRKTAVINDISCLASVCHPSEKFETKKIVFKGEDGGRGVPFVHKTHLEKTIAGQKLHCNTCHQHVRTGKHFQVPKLACYLCHFKNTNFNEGRSKCSLCHEIPTKSLQKEGKKPITHQMLEKAKVACSGCHWEIIGGKGGIKKEDCFSCHEYSADMLEKSADKELMHKEHVAGHTAQCFNCHEPIRHGKVIDYLEPARENCLICHTLDEHIYQKRILMGEAMKGIEKTPSPMFNAHTTCVGCHIEETVGRKGVKIVKGSAVSCALCHSLEYEKLLKDDIAVIQKELKTVLELEKKAEETIVNSKGKIPNDKFKKAMAMFKEGQYKVRIVEYGNGVHNKKYAMALLDSAYTSFERIIDSLK